MCWRDYGFATCDRSISVLSGPECVATELRRGFARSCVAALYFRVGSVSQSNEIESSISRRRDEFLLGRTSIHSRERGFCLAVGRSITTPKGREFHSTTGPERRKRGNRRAVMEHVNGEK
jgi:hypothetical protein